MKYIIILISIIITGGLIFYHPQTHPQFTTWLIIEAFGVFIILSIFIINLLSNMSSKQPRKGKVDNNVLVTIHLLKLLYIVFALVLSPAHLGILQIVGFMVMESLLSTIVIGVSILHQRITRV